MTGVRRRRLPLARAVALCAALAGPAAASDLVEGQTQLIPREESATIGLRNGSFVAAPIPFQNPTIGTGLALGGGYVFQSDDTSATSYVGIGGFRSNNGSSGYGLSGSLAFDDNRWKLSGFAGSVDLTYDLYTGIGIGIREIDQSGSLVKLAGAYGVTPQLSFGIIGRYLDTEISSERSLPFDLLEDIGDLSVTSLGLTADLDRRDDTVYPTTGSDTSLVLYYSELDGVRIRDYQKAILLYDVFRPLGDKAVLAGRAAFCAATDDAPFFDECSLGGTDAMRGFPVTEYLDNRLASVQVEYRRVFTRRLGGVLFAGAGSVGAETDDLSIADAHAAGGVGARIRLSQKFPVDFSIDGSINNQGDELLYIYVGQRF